MSSLMHSSEYSLMHRSEEKLWWYIGMRDVLKHYIKRYSFQQARILDAGCGTGKNMEFLISLGYDNIVGIDYSEEAIDFCHKRNLQQAQYGSITEIAFSGDSFDVVYCMDVLGSLDEDERMIAVTEMLRVLKPGGLLIANSASLEIFRSQHDEVANIKKRFKKAEFRSLFKQYDSGLKKLTYRVFLLSPLVLLFKAGKNLLRTLGPATGPQSDQVIFPLGINWCLTQIQLLENRLLKYFNFPFGSSVFIVLIKSEGSRES
ncbi:class I SAM-dependent methyltransferase [Daejeonella sp. JGW-45]|uniref:class I SAM-dependent methyltransferase n=1 Tax=Daejeonella sp. JGW-45 TaxID=3034148 RepID=UPI0023EE1A4E|nr:class I SAM-dependent methyltransferase [Daejeonella sp. JGW-45]